MSDKTRKPAEKDRLAGKRKPTTEDLLLLDRFAKQATNAAQQAILSIDKTLAFVAQSEVRIQALTKSHRKH